MFPRAPQLWAVHKKTAVGVSDDPVGETYWKVKNGIRLSGMPSYRELLTDDEIWQVSILLSRADKPLPSPAVTLISTPLE
jgi:thiosulfate dehydrogenase